MAKKSNAKPNLKALASTTQGKHYDLHFAMMTPFYPGHPKAFKDAAELILDAQESVKRHNDRLIFPVLYLYRHYLELQLKELVILGVKCGKFKLEEVNDKKKGDLRRHDLDKLWKLVKPFLVESYPKDNRVLYTELIVDDFHLLDKDGQILRFDREKDTLNKRPYKEILPCQITLAELREKMSKVFDHLDSSYGGILDWLDAGRE